MIAPIKTLDVKPRIPKALEALKTLSENLWFVWNYEAEDLFRRISQDLWEEVGKNPVAFLGRLKQANLENLLFDEGFMAHLNRIKQSLDRYLAEDPDPGIFGKCEKPFIVAYFTAECGIADCLPIYSGGLGILSGDHLKSSSDLNLPIVGVSLAYQQGYFRQYLSRDGWQLETFPINDFHNMPMQPVLDGQGRPVEVSVHLKGERVLIRAWQVHIGRTLLILLDTNIKENSEEARRITAQLYGGDKVMRLLQEIVLGIGGVRMLGAMGLEPAVYHMNEGHSAFATFERIRSLREKHALTFNEALEYVRLTSVFTTHTPVPAGIDTFHPELMRTYFDPFARAMGISFDVLLGYGRQDPRDREEEFCMTVLALRLSTWNNGVSRLHARVSRRMWQKIWPKTPEIDLPIVHVTNGVHIPSWISKDMAENYDRYLGPRWIEDPDNVKVWERVDKIPNTELWRAHERGRERLVTFARQRLRKQLAKRGVANRDLAVADEVLSSEALTIGFARRFAPYKRAHLVIRDIQRLKAILTNGRYPVQIIFAGKAHPQDNEGKELIKRLIGICDQENLRRHMVFLEGYDINLARHMVQGVDVWLNTPRRPLEACGTSGMKAVANGALHFSVLDGWWDEGYDKELGWAIGKGEEYEDTEFQDDLESRALYDLLEKDIIPLYYDRGPDGLPRQWLAMMKASLHKLCPMFNTHKMVADYWDRFYLPAAEQGMRLMETDHEALKGLAHWRERIMYDWGKIAIKDIRLDGASDIEVGDSYHIEADIDLGGLMPDDVIVEVYCGQLDPSNQHVSRFTRVMKPERDTTDRLFRYLCDVQFEEVGRFGVNVRITPNHLNPESRHAMGLVIWDQR
ncbi:MAG: alpha-glucan family phosphorylase [Desulfatiglandales bacterium]